MFIFDFIFFTFYRVIYGLASADRRSSAGFGTIVFMSVLSSMYMLFFKKYIKDQQYGAWVILIPAAITFITFFFLYGSEKELIALEERRKNDSILWPFLLVVFLVASFFYALLRD
jgi:hypothetical protein